MMSLKDKPKKKLIMNYVKKRFLIFYISKKNRITKTRSRGSRLGKAIKIFNKLTIGKLTASNLRLLVTMEEIPSSSRKIQAFPQEWSRERPTLILRDLYSSAIKPEQLMLSVMQKSFLGKIKTSRLILSVFRKLCKQALTKI